MLVDRPAADVAAARQRYLSALILAQHSPDKIIRGSDFTDIFVIHGNFVDVLPINTDGMSVNTLNISSDFLDGFQ